MPTVQNAFNGTGSAPAGPPAPDKAEYEVTNNFASGCPDQDVENLRQLVNHPSIVARASHAYVEQLQGEKFYLKGLYDHSLMTRPQTWYLNTKDQALRGTDNLRVRFTPYLRNYYELAVKGKASIFNGPGGLSRHEDELVTSHLQLDPRAFTDPTSQEILAPLLADINNGKGIFFFFATKVERHLVGIEGEVNGKKAMCEAAFDIIEYQCNGHDPDEPLITFSRLCQSEREYMNPYSDLHKEFCHNMGYHEILTIPEIEILLHESSELIYNAANELGIKLDPCLYSKGQIGFMELARHQGLTQAVPPQERFPACT